MAALDLPSAKYSRFTKWREWSKAFDPTYLSHLEMQPQIIKERRDAVQNIEGHVLLFGNFTNRTRCALWFDIGNFDWKSSDYQELDNASFFEIEERSKEMLSMKLGGIDVMNENFLQLRIRKRGEESESWTINLKVAHRSDPDLPIELLKLE